MTDRRTDGHTKQSDKNIPELSLESAGIISYRPIFSYNRLVYLAVHVQELPNNNIGEHHVWAYSHLIN